LPQLACWITYTNERTHAIIRDGLPRSPLYRKEIAGIGPRYCPSIEDKVNRFAGKDSHQIFLEPEGLSTHEVYPNGISTSLPFQVQLDAVHSIAGLENAHIVRPGYAIEYDYFDPRALKPSFETRSIGGLFFAGQINGTTGYEEAAAQGLHAGINAALAVRGEHPWLPSRDKAYLGVLVDDLVNKGVTEPYRMFTSRAEYRLHLREDNADARLTEIGHRLGVVSEARWLAFQRKQAHVSRETERLGATRIGPSPACDGRPELGRDYALLDLLRRPGVGFDDVSAWRAEDGVDGVSRETLRSELGRPLADQVIASIEISARYAGYIGKQQEQIERSESAGDVSLPESLDYATVRALSFEVRQVLSRYRPDTIGRAARLPGVTPAAISLLLVHLKRMRRGEPAANDGGTLRASA